MSRCILQCRLSPGKDNDVLIWWGDNQERFPHVAKMARQYLGMPASSETVERFFSAAGLAHSDLHQRKSDGTLESIMWAKFNSFNKLS